MVVRFEYVEVHASFITSHPLVAVEKEAHSIIHCFLHVRSWSIPFPPFILMKYRERRLYKVVIPHKNPEPCTITLRICDEVVPFSSLYEFSL